MLKNWGVIFCLIFSLVACANNPIRSYKSDSDKMLHAIQNNNTNSFIESAVYGDPKEPDILFYMEYGTYMRLVSQYGSSDSQFAKAQQIVDIWVNSWKNTTSGAIASTATQMLINDSATDYEPKGYEKTMLNTYRALDHIDNNNWQNARIEIKRMYETEQAIANYNQAMYMKAQAEAQQNNKDANASSLNKQILQKYDFSDINSPQVLALKNSYQSAFSHYLAGFVFEALGEPSLSRPGYLKSGQLAPFNKLPQQSITHIDNGNTTKNGYANVLIIQEVGHAPQLKSHEIHIPFSVPIGGQNCVTNINLFFPTLVPDKVNNTDVTYQIDGKAQNQELFTDFNLMAARNLHDIMPHLIARNVAAAIRNIATSAASCSAGGSTGSILDITSMVAGILLDHADERTWVLLPSKVYLNRVQLPLGKHTFSTIVNGHVYTQTIDLNSTYQVIDMRVLGDKFFLNTQKI